MEPHTINVAELIERQKIGAGQCVVVLLCALLMFLDGFDTQAVSYIVPVLSREWHLPRDVLGSIFSAALVGLMVGYLAIAPMSARFGHKRMMVSSALLFSVFTLLTVFATNVTELIVLRFLTGIGLGAAAPSAVALTCEFAPKRLRSTFVLLVYCGFSLGFVAAGFVSGALLESHGWKALMLAGAIAPILLALPLARLLPESLAFLQRDADSGQRIRKVLVRLFPRADLPAGSTFYLDEEDGQRASVAALVHGRAAFGTVLLWLVFFLNLAEFYFMQSWLPVMLTGLHYPLGVVVWVTALPTIAGVLAAVPLGFAMDRVGPYATLTTMYGVGAIFMWLVAGALSQTQDVAWLMVKVFCLGFCISGGQKSVIALAAVYYPQALRSTGVGWALGVGRLGGIAGPLVAGALYAAHRTPGDIFALFAWPVVAAAFGVFVLGRFFHTHPNSPGRDDGAPQRSGLTADGQQG